MDKEDKDKDFFGGTCLKRVLIFRWGKVLVISPDFCNELKVEISHRFVYFLLENV